MVKTNPMLTLSGKCLLELIGSGHAEISKIQRKSITELRMVHRHCREMEETLTNIGKNLDLMILALVFGSLFLELNFGSWR